MPEFTGAPIQVSGLRRRYRSSRKDPGFEAVRGVDLRVERGELLALLGTNGAGKTSTLEVIEGLAPAAAGTVSLLGHDPYRDRAVVRPRIGIMLQEAGFPNALTVKEFAEVWRRTLPRPRSVAECLELVVLGGRADVAIGSLSGGERRRLDLALALMGRPEVLFLDEPTTGLDPQSRRTTWELIQNLVDQQTTVLLTTHYLEEAEVLADRIAILHEGRIATSGTLAEIVARQPSRIGFTVAAGVGLDRLRPAVGAGLEVEPARDRTRVWIETFDSQAMLRTVLDWAGDVVLDDLRVQPGSLERTFLDVAEQGAEQVTEQVAA